MPYHTNKHILACTRPHTCAHTCMHKNTSPLVHTHRHTHGLLTKMLYPLQNQNLAEMHQKTLHNANQETTKL